MSTDDQLREDLRSLMVRFAKAGWVDRSMITPNPCKIDFTPLGTQRMSEMVEYLHDIEASGLEPTAVSVGELGQIVHELLPPNFSQSEFKTLLGLVEMFQKRI
jgi:hypothetical protein